MRASVARQGVCVSDRCPTRRPARPLGEYPLCAARLARRRRSGDAGETQAALMAARRASPTRDRDLRARGRRHHGTRRRRRQRVRSRKPQNRHIYCPDASRGIDARGQQLPILYRRSMARRRIGRPTRCSSPGERRRLVDLSLSGSCSGAVNPRRRIGRGGRARARPPSRRASASSSSRSSADHLRDHRVRRGWAHRCAR